MDEFIEYDKECLKNTKEEIAKLTNDINISINEIDAKIKELNYTIQNLPNVSIRYNNKFNEIYNWFKSKNSSIFYQEVPEGYIRLNVIGSTVKDELLNKVLKGSTYLFLINVELERVFEMKQELSHKLFKNPFYKLLYSKEIKTEEELNSKVFLPDRYFEKINGLIENYIKICNDITEYDFIKEIPELMINRINDSEANIEDKKALVNNVLKCELNKLGFDNESINKKILKK